LSILKHGYWYEIFYLQGYQGLYRLMEKRMVGGQEHYFVKKDAIEAFFARMENDKKE